jgi:hypothetical protein
MKACTTVHPSVFILILFRNKFRLKATAHQDYEGLLNSSSICFHTPYRTPGLGRPAQQFIHLFSYTILFRNKFSLKATVHQDYEDLHNI